MVNDEATADRFEEAIIVDGDNENENEITFTDDIHDEQAENWFHCETEEPREEPLSVWYDCESEVTNEDIPGSTEDDQPTSEEGNIPIYQGASLTVAHSALLILTFAMRHNLTGECLSDLLTLISLHCLSTSFIHTSLYKFRTYFSKLKAPLIFQKYCSNCEGLLQKNTDNCHICNINLSEKKVSYFVEIPIAYQLQQLFSRTTFHQELLHRFKRKMHNKGNIEDVYDGKLYSSLSHNSGFLDDANIISFMWYTDGVPLFKSSKISLWPLFLTINELPYLERIKQDNMLFAGLWFGKSKPSMASFLRPFHDSFNNLQKNGINVECAHCSHITVRGLVLCGTCDLPAKCTMMNMHQFNGQYGCPKCKQEGTVVKTWKGHTRIYPFCEDLIHGPKRTHKEFIIDGEKEFATSKHVYGVKGPSWWVDISADVINGIGIDYMHTVLLGLVRRLLVLWFDPKFSSETFSISSLVDVANKRLGLIKPPYFINRKPRSIKEHAHYWKASECRAWLFFYSIPVLYGLLKKATFEHYALLVDAIFILNLESISEEQLVHCEELLIKFNCLFASIYGSKHMSANLHQLLHLCDTVRQLGPLWVYSCFRFESINGKLIKLFHGTQNPVVQIANAVTTLMKLPVLSEEIPRDTLTWNFYTKLTSTRYHYSVTETIMEGVYVIGGKHLHHIEEKYLNAIAIHLNVAPGICYKFYRSMIKGVLIKCSEYKMDSGNSFTVQFVYRSDLCYGHVLFYVKCYPICACRSINCKCCATYLAIIRRIYVCDETLIDGTELVSPKLQSIIYGYLTDIYTAVPLENIIDLCTFVDFKTTNSKVFVVSRPNKIEGD